MSNKIEISKELKALVHYNMNAPMLIQTNDPRIFKVKGYLGTCKQILDAYCAKLPLKMYWGTKQCKFFDYWSEMYFLGEIKEKQPPKTKHHEVQSRQSNLF